MSLSMREGRDFSWTGSFDEAPAAATLVGGVPYEPDLTAYMPDPRNDRRATLKRQIDKGLVESVDVRIGCLDGTLESFTLQGADAKTYLEAGLKGDLALRESLVNARIMERRLKEALKAYETIAQAGSPHIGSPTPSAEAALREFDGIIRRASLREGERGIREGKDGEASFVETLRPRFREAAHRTLEALSGGRIEKIREDGFFDGSFDPADGYYRPWSDREYLARGGPAYRQQLVADVWDAQAKNYYAWSHDPVIREGCAILTEFPLGRGVRVVCKDAGLQNFVDGVWKQLRLDRNIPIWANTLSRDGELFLRIIRQGDGSVRVVALDPQTIWEIVTDAEDVSKVFYYVQRYPTRFQLNSSEVPDAQVRYVDRTIAANDVIHIKINADAHDVRGRSDSFPALGWAKRLRDYADAEVQKSQAHAAYQWDVSVDGGKADLDRIAASVPGGRPQPGASWVHNSKVKVEAVASGASGSTSGNGSTYELLLNQIALAFGVPKDYFGVSSRGSRATALVAADPASKRFEDRQNIIKSDLVEPIMAQIIDEARRYRLLEAVNDWTWRASFAAIVKADASTRATLLANAKADGAISHRTFAEELSGELDLEDFDYEEEQQQILTEIGVEGWKISSKTSNSVKRGLPDKTDAAFDPGEVPNPSIGEPGGPVLNGDGTAPPGAAPANHVAKPEEPPKPDAGAVSPASAPGAAKIRAEVGAHEAARRRLHEAAALLSEAGGFVVLP